jgi:hypothetical protein
MRNLGIVTALFVALGASQASAQGRSENRGRNADGVPPGHRPPAGMCRIWIDGVPPGKQPAVTDCRTAIARRPANARVIFGDDSAFPGRGKTRDDVACTTESSIEREVRIGIGTVIGIPVPDGRAADDVRCRDDDDRGRILDGRILDDDDRDGRAGGSSNGAGKANRANKANKANKGGKGSR